MNNRMVNKTIQNFMSRQIQARSASDRHLSGPFNFDDYFFQSKLWPRHKTVERALLSTNDEHSPPLTWLLFLPLSSQMISTTVLLTPFT